MLYVGDEMTNLQKRWFWRIWIILVVLIFLSLASCASRQVPYDQRECEASKNWQFNYVTNYSEEDLRQIEYYTKGVCTGGFTK